MTDRTNISIPDSDKLLIKSLGFENFSEFIRLCMDGALSEEDEICSHCGQLIDRRKSKAINIGHNIKIERLKQQTIVEPEPIKEPEKKIRCFDKAADAYALIAVSEIEAHPHWYTVDEPLSSYGVNP